MPRPGSAEQTANASPAELLGAVLDTHLRWFGFWHRCVFFYGGWGDGEVAEAAPASFAAWCAAASRDDLAQQPAVARLAELHERMHRQAKLMQLKGAAGHPPAPLEYEQVARLFEEFTGLLRRMERAFGAAASGLDPLTGLRSRHGMVQTVSAEIERLVMGGPSFCLALCDLDHFKRVNETLGHGAGDQALAGAAGILSRSLGDWDEVFRMGGEEFLILMRGCPLDEAGKRTERLRQTLATEPSMLGDGRTVSLTASFGLVEARSGTGRAYADGQKAEAFTADELLNRAGRALKHAKQTGRDRVVIARDPVANSSPAPTFKAASQTRLGHTGRSG